MCKRNLLFILIFGTFLSASFATEDRLSLNGLWEVQIRSELLEETPPETGWETTPIRIPSSFNGNGFTSGNGPDFRHYPSYPESWNDALAAWHRREISIPTDWAEGRTFLRFEASHLRTVVFLNGVQVGENDEGFLPFEFDLTDRVSPGETLSLVVGVESSTLLGVGDFGKIPAPHGSFWGRENSGIWGDVSLVHRPSLRLASPRIETSVRDSTAAFVFEVRNDTDIEQSVRVAYQILEASSGNPVRSGETNLPVLGNRSATQEIRIDWSDPHFWSPDDPFLYLLRTQLQVGDDEIDSATTRFGFREFELIGGEFYLNGIKTRLLADSWHWMGAGYQDPEYARGWIRLAKDSNLNCLRLHAQVYPEFYLDLADEMGILIVGESAHWGSAADLLYNDDTWRRLNEQWEKILMRDRNHPCIILWSLANEIIPGSDIDSHDDLEGTEEYLAEMSALAERVDRLDGTRPIYAEGDADGYGFFDVISYHYPGPQFGDSLEFWRNLDTAVSIGEAGPMFYVDPKYVCNWRGPSTYLSYRGMLESTGDNLVWLVENYRLWAEHIAPFNLIWYGLEPLEFSGDPIEYTDLTSPGAKPERIGPYSRTLNLGADPSLPEFILNPVGDAIRSSMRPVTLIPVERDTDFYGGTIQIRNFYALNDLPRAVTFTLEWDYSLAGETLETFSVPLTIDPAEDRKLAIPLNLPSVPERRNGVFRVALYEADILRTSRELNFQVWPEAEEVEGLSEVGLTVYDPSETLSLERLDLGDWNRTAGPDLILPSTDQILMIGPYAGIDEEERRQLFAHVRDGGRVMVLEGNPGALPTYAGVDESVSPESPFSWFAYANGNHPLIHDLSPEDLCCWGADNSLLCGWTRDLSIGNAKSPLVSGCGGALLIDLPIGQGRMVISHLRLGEKSESHPVALHLLAESLSYLTSAPISQTQPATLWAPEDSPLENSLNALGVVFEKSEANSSTLLIDASDSDWLAEVGAPLLSEIVGNPTGEPTTAVLWNLSQEGVSVLSSLLPEGIEIVAADHPFLVPHGDLMDGVYPESTYWFEGYLQATSVIASGMRVDGSPSQREDFLVAPSFDWRALIFEAETTRTSAILRSEREDPPLSISGLSAYSLGPHRLILCWLRADTTFSKNRTLVSTFLSNIGVEIDPFLPTPDLQPDDHVDWQDLFVFSQGWIAAMESTPGGSRSDFNQDGRVNAPDLHQYLHHGREFSPAPSLQPKGKAFQLDPPRSKAESLWSRMKQP